MIDLTNRLKSDGILDWEMPAGDWTIMRFVSRNNGANTRPAPQPGYGFESDKFSKKAFGDHFDNYIGKLLKKVGRRKTNAGWTMLHMDSWEMGAQNWTQNLPGALPWNTVWPPFRSLYSIMAGRTTRWSGSVLLKGTKPSKRRLRNYAGFKRNYFSMRTCLGRPGG